ncbi:hypothetical protein CRG98_014771 [Punica granatum]|uniref:Uncharacterized protein n=1 Tax=Punica granatum TaxID=22663 RepID=A0A2I0KAR7_PUNGR|nr:hypothetical protein CRG98_014771 [Punica granatum]
MPQGASRPNKVRPRHRRGHRPAFHPTATNKAQDDVPTAVRRRWQRARDVPGSPWSNLVGQTHFPDKEANAAAAFLPRFATVGKRHQCHVATWLLVGESLGIWLRQFLPEENTSACGGERRERERERENGD